MRKSECNWLRGFLLALPLVWLTAGCGGGADPPKDAADTTAPSVDAGEPADEGSEEALAEPAAVVEGWGSVKGRIVYGGDPPAQPEIDIPATADFCKDHQIVGESLVVNSENKGIANVFVYLRRAPKEIAPELAEVPAEPAILDQRLCAFLPHAQVVRKGQPFKVLSDDPIRHNTQMSPLKNQRFNQILKPNDRDGLDVNFNFAENLPFPAKCDIHSWMNAYILVLDHPYGVVTDAEGNFEISQLPAGPVALTIWQEKAGSIERAKKVTIVADETKDIGEVVVGADKFSN